MSAIPFPTAPATLARGYPYPARACQCDHPVEDHNDPDHCIWCGHDLDEIITGTWSDQARRTDSASKRLAIAA